MINISNDPTPVIKRVTPEVNELLGVALRAASQAGQSHVAPQHLLEGLLLIRPCRGNDVLLNLGHQPLELLARLRAVSPIAITSSAGDDSVIRLPFSKSSMAVFAVAEFQRIERFHRVLDTDHLLVGLRSVKGTRAASFLRNEGISLSEVMEDFVNLRGE